MFDISLTDLYTSFCMNQFLLPQNLFIFLKAKIKDEGQIPKIIDLLHTAMSEERLTKKRAPNGVFYTLNVDFGRHAHRAVFERVFLEDVPYFALRDFVWSHHYLQALRWKPLKQVSKENLELLYKGPYELFLETKEVVEQEEEVEDSVFYRDNWLTPTPLQQQIIQGLKFPSLLIGPPGSGKTLMAMRLLQEQALAHFESENPEVLRLLYITDNGALVHEMQQQWQYFATHTFPADYKSVDVSTLTHEQCVQWYVESNSLIIEDLQLPERDKQELIHNAPYLLRDTKAKKAYQDSEYSHIGGRNSVYTEAERELVYPRLCSFLASKKEVFLNEISSMTHFPEGFCFDLILVDEAQKLSLSFLTGMLHATKNNQVLYLGDSLQKGQQVFSSLAALKACVYAELKQELSVHHLVTSLRLKPGVARLVNELVVLYGHLNEGKADAVSYTQIPTTPLTTNEETHIQVLPPLQEHLHLPELQAQLHDNPKAFKASRLHLLTAKECPRTAQEQSLAKLGEDAQAAVIILSEKDRAPAKVLIQAGSVFTAHEARGLEFSRTLIYLSADTLILFRIIAQLMNIKGITPGATLEALQNQSPFKEKRDNGFLSLLSDLLISCSRTQGELYFYIEQAPHLAHTLHPFLPWLLHRTGEIHCLAVKSNPVSSEQEWFKTIQSYIQEQAFTQAKDNLKQVFEFTETQAQKYIELNATAIKINSLEDFIAWRAEQKAPKQITPKAEPEPTSKAVKKLTKPQARKASSPLALKAAITKESTNIYFKLKEDFTPKSWLFFNTAIEVSNSKFWSSSQALDLVQFITATPRTHEILFTYYASRTLQKGNSELDCLIKYNPNKEDHLHKTLEHLKLIIQECKQYLVKKQLLNNNSWTPLLCAALMKKEKYIEFLCTYVSDINVVDNNQETVLHKAAQNGLVATLKLLHQRGVDLNTLSSKGLTAAHIAALNGNIEFLVLLKECGFNFNNRNSQGETPLFYAAGAGQDRAVELLIPWMDNPHQPDAIGRTPFFFAVARKCISTCKLLYKLGADVHQPNLKGEVPFYYVIQMGLDNMIEPLVEMGADVNTLFHDGVTPAILAAETDHPNTLKILKKLKADIEKKGLQGQTPMYHAASLGYDRVVQVLKNLGSDINVPNVKGGSPIFAAIYANQVSTVKLLCELGANLSIDPFLGLSPVCLAVTLDRVQLIRILHSYGADLNITPSDGCTPLMVAIEKGSQSCVEYLLKHKVKMDTAVVYSRQKLFNFLASKFTMTLAQMRIDSIDSDFMSATIALSPTQLAEVLGYDEILALLHKAANDAQKTTGLQFFKACGKEGRAITQTTRHTPS